MLNDVNIHGSKIEGDIEALLQYYSKVQASYLRGDIRILSL